jgi:hypothetical protein
VVNGYLAVYGIREVEPIRARYLAAAVPFALMVAVTIVSGLELENWTGRNLVQNPRPGWHRALATSLRLNVIWFGSTALNVGLLLYLGQVPSGSIGDVALYFASVAVFTLGTLVTGASLRGREGKWRSWIASNAFVGIVGTMIFAIGGYASSIYPSVPTWLGGGRPDDVELAVESTVGSLCAPCVSGETVKLIDADTTRIVILLTDARGTRAVEIARSEVRAISHKPKR